MHRSHIRSSRETPPVSTRKPKAFSGAIKPLVLAGVLSVSLGVCAANALTTGDTSADFAQAHSSPNPTKGKPTATLSEPKPFVAPLLQTMT